MAQSVWVFVPGSGIKAVRDGAPVDELVDEWPDLIYFYAELVPPDTKAYPHKDGPYMNIGPEAFTDGDVISYKGENYYRACDIWVSDMIGGGQSFCVKRVNHPGKYHEDFEGVTRHV